MKLLLILFSIYISTFQKSETYNLTLSISNIKEVKGGIGLSVFNNASSFPKKDGAYKTYYYNVTGKTMSITIKDLKKGDYALAIYHDANGDKECNLNFLGIPKEMYGFSNNIKPKLSAPSFADCKIDLNSNSAITIKLID
ncbi:MAG: DUF2141 domain-containing protein [Pelobium sp.]